MVDPTHWPAPWPNHLPPGGVVFWFRQDLRLHDNPALTHAVQLARQHHTWLLPVVVLDPAQTTALTPWGFARQGPHRAQFVTEGTAAKPRHWRTWSATAPKACHTPTRPRATR